MLEDNPDTVWGVSYGPDRVEEADDRREPTPPTSLDPVLAQQMARYWLACIRAGNAPEVAATKLLRVFDLAPRVRPMWVDDQQIEEARRQPGVTRKHSDTLEDQ